MGCEAAKERSYFETVEIATGCRRLINCPWGLRTAATLPKEGSRTRPSRLPPRASSWAIAPYTSSTQKLRMGVSPVFGGSATL